MLSDHDLIYIDERIRVAGFLRPVTRTSSLCGPGWLQTKRLRACPRLQRNTNPSRSARAVDADFGDTAIERLRVNVRHFHSVE